MRNLFTNLYDEIRTKEVELNVLDEHSPMYKETKQKIYRKLFEESYEDNKYASRMLKGDSLESITNEFFAEKRFSLKLNKKHRKEYNNNARELHDLVHFEYLGTHYEHNILSWYGFPGAALIMPELVLLTTLTLYAVADYAAASPPKLSEMAQGSALVMALFSLPSISSYFERKSDLNKSKNNALKNARYIDDRLGLKEVNKNE